MKLTKAQRAALEVAVRNGGTVHAGFNVDGRGHGWRVSAPALRALAVRGLVVLDVAIFGGMGGRVTEAGRAALKEPE